MSAEVPDNSMSQRPSPCPMWYAQELHLQERRKMITNMCVFLQNCHNLRTTQSPDCSKRVNQMPR